MAYGPSLSVGSAPTMTSGTITGAFYSPYTTSASPYPTPGVPPMGAYYSPPPNPYTEAAKKIKPRITKMAIFTQSGSDWFGDTGASGSFESWQKLNPSILIISTHPYVLQSPTLPGNTPSYPQTPQTFVLVTYSIEI